ncbi:MAG TPA: SDR family oxidoreductase, partial [Chroococcales cyanobacterium]
NEVVRSIEQAGGTAIFVKADVTDPAQVKELFERIRTETDGLDVLVNCAGGVIGNDDFFKATSEDVLTSFKANFFSAFYCSQEAATLIKEGAIVNVGSVCGLEQTPVGESYTVPLYGAAKAALHNLNQNMAQLLAPSIRVNAVLPGYTSTPGWGDEGALKSAEHDLGGQPLRGCFGTPEEIADVIYLLATNANMTGSLVVADGGLMVKDKKG